MISLGSKGQGPVISTQDDDDENSAVVLKTALEKAFRGKQPLVPVFLIAYGPPGSGKSSVVQWLFDDPERRVRADEVIDIDIDAIVALFPGYQRRRAEARSHEAREQLYWEMRRRADPISDSILAEALLGRYSVRWETTGQSVAWTAREVDRVTGNGYQVWLVYPLVEKGDLAQRIERRQATQQGARNVGQIIDRARENLPAILPMIDRLIMIDNSGPVDSQRILFEITRVYSGDGSKGTLGIVEKCTRCLPGEHAHKLRLLGASLLRDLEQRCQNCSHLDAP